MASSNFSIQAILDLNEATDVKVRRDSLDSTTSSNPDASSTEIRHLQFSPSHKRDRSQFEPFLSSFHESKAVKRSRHCGAGSPELPSSTTVDADLPLQLSPIRQSHSSALSSHGGYFPGHQSLSNECVLPSPDPRHNTEYPDWTQKQLRGGGGGGRRPYSRSCVMSLSWWYRHLPYLATAEMETLAAITRLSRHQIKIWWQNRRHSQRSRAADTAGQLTAGLPVVELGGGGVLVPGPQSTERGQLFNYLLQFYFSQVVPRISFSQSYTYSILDCLQKS